MIIFWRWYHDNTKNCDDHFYFESLYRPFSTIQRHRWKMPWTESSSLSSGAPCSTNHTADSSVFFMNHLDIYRKQKVTLYSISVHTLTLPLCWPEHEANQTKANKLLKCQGAINHRSKYNQLNSSWLPCPYSIGRTGWFILKPKLNRTEKNKNKNKNKFSFRWTPSA